MLLDPGLGKTSIMFAVAKILKQQQQSRGTLVIAPLRPARLVWPKEQEKWADFADVKTVLLHGDSVPKKLKEDADVYLINYESIPRYFTRRKASNVWKYELTPLGKELMSKVNVLVYDELSKMKDTNTLRYKLLKKWIPKFDRRYGLTGSFASNGLINLFGQCYCLDEGNALGPYVTHYRARYFNQIDDYGRVFVLKPGAEEQIYDKLHNLVLRMDAEDHVKMPKLRVLPIKLELPGDLRAMYDKLEADLLLKVGPDVLTAKNTAVLKNMLRQFVSGSVYKPQVDFLTGIAKVGKRDVVQLHTEKLDALEDLLEELQGQQVFIAYDFQHEKDALKARFPSMQFFGESEKKDAALEAQWNAGEVQWAAGQPGSVAHGLNLQESGAHNIVWYTLTWDYELYDQFNRRLRRQGNAAEYLNCYVLTVKGTVDEYVTATLKDKDRTQSTLYEALKARRLLEDDE